MVAGTREEHLERRRRRSSILTQPTGAFITERLRKRTPTPKYSLETQVSQDEEDSHGTKEKDPTMKQTELVKLIMEAIGEEDQPPMAEAPESQSKWAFPAKQAPAALAKAKISGAFRVLEQHRDDIQKL